MQSCNLESASAPVFAPRSSRRADLLASSEKSNVDYVGWTCCRNLVAIVLGAGSRYTSAPVKTGCVQRKRRPTPPTPSKF